MKIISALISIMLVVMSIQAQLWAEQSVFNKTNKDSYKEFRKGKDTIQWWERLYSGVITPFGEQQMIYKYTYGDFSSINNRLRAGYPVTSLTRKEQDMVSTLDMALEKLIIFENIKVYRYETLSFFSRLISEDIVFAHIYKNGKFLDGAEQYLDLLIKKSYRDYGFMSTTLIRNSVFQHRIVELVIKVPKYTTARFVSLKGFAAFETQYEMLFPRGAILVIQDYKISEDRKKITIFTKMAGPCYIGRPCYHKVNNLNQPKENNSTRD